MPVFEKIKTQEKVDFVRNLSLLIKSGSPINLSFNLLAKQARNPSLKKVLLKGKEKTEQGTPIYQIFDEDKNFDNIFVSFIRAGEESGTLVENLLFLGDWLDRENNLKKEMSSATLYPKIIIIFATVLGAGLSIFVLPNLIKIFEGMDVELPITTIILLEFTRLMENYGIYMVMGMILFFIFFYLLSKIKTAKKIIDKMMLNIPIFGDLNKEYQLTIISQLAAILFKSGLPVKQILIIVRESVTNGYYSNSLDEIRKRVEKGTKLSEALEHYPKLYPEVFLSVIVTGESAGSLGESLNYLASFFKDKVTDRTKKLPVVIEPLLLIFIGIFVAFIASAIVLPVYQITTGI